MFDYLIIGAGMAGIVLAERITSVLDKKVLIIEKRNHIGGNCYDHYDENGILVHKYGPHIFRTNKKEVWDYLSNFTEWNLYQHEVLGLIDGKKVPVPFNLNSLEKLLPNSLSEHLEKKLISEFGYNVKIPILKLKEIDDEDLRFLADFIYEKVFLNYTIKQWGMEPKELDSSVTGRVPVYISRDNRYFQEKYQGLPREGFSKLFNKMLNNPKIKLMLNTDFKDVIDVDHQNNKIFFLGNEFKGKMIYTGKIDEFFNYEFGELPYRSLRFEFENHNSDYFQEVGTVNYPNEYDFTRITEYKHLTGQKNFTTSIVKEYPLDYNRKNNSKQIPYYPIPKNENLQLYAKYNEKAQNFSNVIFLGRLAEYKYYGMDDVVNSALKTFGELYE
ncbi:MAG TPA: UDP-galactopyranose mutase [Methanobacterium sp.]|nr:UDP-galactopyranose mutase [Methanobacterium sp.]